MKNPMLPSTNTLRTQKTVRELDIDFNDLLSPIKKRMNDKMSMIRLDSFNLDSSKKKSLPPNLTYRSEVTTEFDSQQPVFQSGKRS